MHCICVALANPISKLCVLVVVACEAIWLGAGIKKFYVWLWCCIEERQLDVASEVGCRHNVHTRTH